MDEPLSSPRPVLVAGPRPFLSEDLVVEAGIEPLTLHQCAAAVWAACAQLGLPLRSFAVAMEFVQTLLVLTPSIVQALQEPVTPPTYTVASVSGGCLLAALLSEDTARKPDEVARACTTDCLAIVAVQREALEARGFRFASESVPHWVLKLGKALQLHDTQLVRNAWLLAADSCATLAFVQLPAPSIALACIRLALVAANQAQAPHTANVHELCINQHDEARAMLMLLDHHAFCRAQLLPTHGSMGASKLLEMQFLLRDRIEEKKLADKRRLKRSAEPCQLNRAAISREGFARYKFRKL